MIPLRVVFAVLISLLTIGPATADVPRIALVIGNGGYNFSPLQNPPNDAALMAETLRGVGFDVTELVDLDRRALKRAFRYFGEQLQAAGPEAVGLVYYAGHGVQVDGENYFIPVNARIEDEYDVEIEGVRASSLLKTLRNANAALNIVILDACRNDPFKRSSRSGTRGLAKMDAPTGTLLAYSTSPGNVAVDGTGKNSPYTKALARAMQEPGAKIEEVFKDVRIRVIETTQGKQVPWESSSLTGDFSFIDRVSETSEAASTGTRTQAGEIEYWKSISDSDSAILYKAYLEEFPNGLFRTIALQRLASVTEPTLEPTVEPIIEPAVEPAIDDDLTVFQSIQNSSDASDFEAYLQQFPDGKFAPLAKARIEAIKLSQQQASVNTTTTVPITRTVPKSEFVKQLMGANDTIGLMKEIERQIDADTAWVAQGIWNSLSTGWKAAARFENGDILLKFSKQGRITKCREKFELGAKLDFYCHFRGRQLWIRGVFPWIKFPKGRAEYLFTNRILESFLAENGITIVD